MVPCGIWPSTYLIWAAVFHNLCTEVGALDGAQVLLVTLAVAGILVEHVGIAGLRLGLNDSVPQLLGLEGAPTTTFLLIPTVHNTRCTVVLRK